MIDLDRRGYRRGGGMISADREYFYLSIPKNASSYISAVLNDNKWEIWNLEDKAYNNAIIILRDPVDRWISGFATYAAKYFLSKEYRTSNFIKDYNELVEKFIFDNLIFDDHTAPQSFFVNNLPEVNKIYVKADRSTLVNSFSSIVNQELNIQPNTFDNATASNETTNIIQKFILSKLTDNLINKIKEIYKADYDLINQVKFYDAR